MSFCSRPIWQRLTDAVTDPNALFDWVFCPYAVDIGINAVAGIMIVTGFVGIKNWSESWTLPAVWLALMTPLVAGYLFGGLVRQIAGVLTFGVVMLFLGLYYWWGRT